MSGPTVAHLTSAIALVGGGMLIGHVLSPFGAGAGVERRIGFAIIMLLLGAWRGGAEYRARAEWNGANPDRTRASGAAGIGAAAAVALAAIGYWAAHG